MDEVTSSYIPVRTKQVEDVIVIDDLINFYLGFVVHRQFDSVFLS